MYSQKKKQMHKNPDSTYNQLLATPNLLQQFFNNFEFPYNPMHAMRILLYAYIFLCKN